jgi:hypothetical protein
MKRKYKLILAFVLILAFSVWALISFGIYRLANPSYLFYVLSDKPFTKDILVNHLIKDPLRHELVRNMTHSQIRQRFGKLIVDKSQDQKQFVEFIEQLINSRDEFKNKNVDCLWLTMDFPIIIIIIDDKGYELNLFKG